MLGDGKRVRSEYGILADMKVEIYYYIRSVFPYIILTGIIAFTILKLFFTREKRKKIYRLLMGGAGGVYILTVLFVTLAMREPGTIHDYKLQPLWSYQNVMETGNMEMMIENIANMALFFPGGMFLMDWFDKHICWYHCAVILFLCSLGIEIMQLLFGLGTFEIDDMIHNTLGGILGYLVAIKIQHVVRHRNEI